MNVINATLEAVCVGPEGYPSGDLPEIAFAGRSNVGKSSLINCMMNRKALARTSRSPGKTRTINFYNLDDKLRFVDLPGYGYAKVSRSESRRWGPMIEGYLLKRGQLKRIIMLVDIRHEPTANDVMLFSWLRAKNLNTLVVATKADKVTKNRLQSHLAVIRRAFEMPAPPIAFSSETKAGRDDLWTIIEDAVQT